MKNILVVGAGGQIGSELVPYLRKIYGNEYVVAADINSNACIHLAEEGPFEELDALKADRYLEIVKKYRIDTIFNLVALLSATGEKKPQLAWHVNMGALMNSLEIARENSCAVFTPSSIGAFGPTSPLDNTPQDTVMRPTTIYGICKVTGELLSDYYFLKYGVDTRSVRFPGIISNVTLPGGGTTDYAVEIFYGAVQHKHYVCPLPEGTYLDMMYMPDALDACVQLMEADPSKL
ncbi:MAG TPA: NAD-dependent epimerase/dehydratase family protein, partial [Tenuifilaceae bacterium]|nr:NAD-dependent epimerase/dehydratase family protein [Tenuifilaceae bacterium]